MSFLYSVSLIFLFPWWRVALGLRWLLDSPMVLGSVYFNAWDFENLISGCNAFVAYSPSEFGVVEQERESLVLGILKSLVFFY